MYSFSFSLLFSSPWILVSRPRGWPFAIMGLHRYDGSPHQQHRNQNQTSHTDFFFSYSFLSSPYTQNGDENSLRRRNHVRIIFEECFKNPSAVWLFFLKQQTNWKYKKRIKSPLRLYHTVKRREKEAEKSGAGMHTHKRQLKILASFSGNRRRPESGNENKFFSFLHNFSFTKNTKTVLLFKHFQNQMNLNFMVSNRFQSIRIQERFNTVIVCDVFPIFWFVNSFQITRTVCHAGNFTHTRFGWHVLLSIVSWITLVSRLLSSRCCFVFIPFLNTKLIINFLQSWVGFEFCSW